MRIAVIPGDGIGVDTTAEAVKAIRAVGDVFGRQFDLEMLPWGADYFLQTGITMPPDGYAMLRDQFDAIFIGALGDPRVPDNRHARDILLGTRFELDLYVNYRPVKLLDARLCPLKERTTADVNFVVFRENTEGLYVSIGGRFKAGTEDEVAIQEEVNTYKGVHRIVKHAFEFAKANGRRSVCMTDKSNAMAQGHALWQRVFKEVAPQYPGIEARHLYIDALALLLVQNPAQFDVIVTNNLFGDIITDLGAGAAGRAGAGGVRQPASRQDVDVRAGARLGAAAGRQERREPDGRDPLRGADARLPRAEAGSGRGRSGRAGSGRHRTGTREIGGSLGTRETGDYIAGRSNTRDTRTNTRLVVSGSRKT